MSLTTGLTLSPLEAMRLAINEGEKGWGRVSPNPLVGCVIVDRDGSLLSVGYHPFNGGPHAEIEALSKLGDEDTAALKGATVYVTLEPCAHQGRTGSCAQKLAKLPIARVVYGLIDPNELVSGKGVEILRAAGIEVLSITEAIALGGNGSLGEISQTLVRDLEQLCEHFLWNQTEKKPFIALKAATTLDGMMASSKGESKWISNETSREETHRLRAGFDAVLVGKKTFFADNPSLDARHELAIDQNTNLRLPNKAIVLDRQGEGLARLADSNLMKVRPAENIYWVVENPPAHTKIAEDLGIQLVQGPMANALSWFYEKGVHSIFVEGGAAIHSHFIEEDLAQRLYLFIAPQLAGNLGEHWTRGYAAPSWEKRSRLVDVKIRSIEGDIYWTGRFEK